MYGSLPLVLYVQSPASLLVPPVYWSSSAPDRSHVSPSGSRLRLQPIFYKPRIIMFYNQNRIDNKSLCSGVFHMLRELYIQVSVGGGGRSVLD